MSERSFFAELKRRNVLRAAALYIGAAWALSQGVAQILPVFDFPNWVVRWFVIAAIIGFPFAMLFSWFYEWTPHGIVRESEITPDQSITRETGKKMDRWIIAILSVAVVLLLADKFVLHKDENAATTAQAPGKSIAVLPFENLSADKDNAYFADGIQDEILTRLAKIGALKVISRTSTQQYASKPGNLPEIARQLSVANILEGSVQKSGDSVRINVQLIQANGDSHLWAETYDRKLTDIFAVESEVATAIAGSLQATLTGSEQRALAVKPTNNAAAYDAYLRGLVLDAGGSFVDDAPKAAAAFSEAVRLDPQFALAWAQLARVRAFLSYAGIDATENTRDAVKQAADTALRLQPELGEAWLAQGLYRYKCLGDYDGALQAFDEARKRVPNNAQVFEAIAYVERRQGRWDDGLTNMQLAAQLDPLNLGLLGTLGDAFLRPMRRFAQARAVLDRALLVAPGSAAFLVWKAQTYQQEGRLDEAAKLLDPLPVDSGDSSVFFAKVDQQIYARRFDAAIAAIHAAPPRLAESLSNDEYFAIKMAYLQLWAGHLEEAHAAFGHAIGAIKSSPDFTRRNGNRWPMLLASAYAGAGDQQMALDQAHKAIELYHDDAPARLAAEINLAQIQAHFGDKDSAIAALPRMLAIPDGVTVGLLRFDPAWDPLRKDPRFQKLIADGEAAQAQTNP
jgi:TolB-like protein